MPILANLHNAILRTAMSCNNILQSMIISMPSLSVNSKTHRVGLELTSATWSSGTKSGSAWRKLEQQTIRHQRINLVIETFSLLPYCLLGETIGVVMETIWKADGIESNVRIGRGANYKRKV